MPTISFDTNTIQLTSFSFTYDGLSDVTTLNGIFEAIGPRLQDLIVCLKSPTSERCNDREVEHLSLRAFSGLYLLKLDLDLWRGTSQLLRLLSSLPRPVPDLMRIIIEINVSRDLRARVWEGVEALLTSFEEPPMLELEFVFENKLHLDTSEEMLEMFIQAYLPQYVRADLLSFDSCVLGQGQGSEDGVLLGY
ncbi:hypothetical protein H0H81_012669 [Sphagnurus paluster]|uniref:Uncharacterized protein n=1 Tax=Sphagnurus paluster TaxID=117069 RepID=A0A9P7FRP0_9AGAR|nr:hypothetical protein H0H81_012669 [Sphagnurus paluster]